MLRATVLSLGLAMAAALPSARPAFAGPQYVDATGFAASGYDVVSYFGLTQAPIGQSQPVPLPGRAAITADYNGARFAFATEANRAAFLADPARYAPQYDGHCAYGVAGGYKVPGNPTLWRIVDGKLYLNITRDVVGYWERDIPGNITRAGDRWTKLEPDAASTGAVPDLAPEAPITP